MRQGAQRGGGGGGQVRVRRQVDREPLGRIDLRHQIAVGEGRRVAERKAASVARDHDFQRGKARSDPVSDPCVHLRLVETELAAQPLQHAQIVQRMDVAADRRRHRPNDRAAAGVGGQKGRVGMAFLQPFEDGGALGQGAVADLERRD